jgi:deoxyribose-phosphate aldolase
MGLDLDRSDFAARIDHTVLGPTTTPADVHRVVGEAEEYGTNVCIPPCYVAGVGTDATVATVVGFPPGHHATAVKRAEAERAWGDGADELDVVINVGRLKAGALDRVERDLAEVVAATPCPVKAIIETALLTDDEKRAACRAAADADAAMVKTSTGFAEGGATVPDVELMSEYLPVKASGGVGSYEEAMTMFEAGAERIGASSGVAIVEGYPGE